LVNRGRQFAHVATRKQVASISQLELVIVSDHIALRSDTWQRELDFLGLPPREAWEKMAEEAQRLETAGWKIIDEREESRRPKQRLRRAAGETKEEEDSDVGTELEDGGEDGDLEIDEA